MANLICPACNKETDKLVTHHWYELSRQKSRNSWVIWAIKLGLRDHRKSKNPTPSQA